MELVDGMLHFARPEKSKSDYYMLMFYRGFLGFFVNLKHNKSLKADALKGAA